MDKHKLVYIEWHDAFANAGWVPESHIEIWKQGNWIIKEVGWLIDETDKQIILASRISPENDTDEAQYGALQKIPKTWIRKRINLTKHIK